MKLRFVLLFFLFFFSGARAENLHDEVTPVAQDIRVDLAIPESERIAVDESEVDEAKKKEEHGFWARVKKRIETVKQMVKEHPKATAVSLLGAVIIALALSLKVLMSKTTPEQPAFEVSYGVFKPPKKSRAAFVAKKDLRFFAYFAPIEFRRAGIVGNEASQFAANNFVDLLKRYLKDFSPRHALMRAFRATDTHFAFSLYPHERPYVHEIFDVSERSEANKQLNHELETMPEEMFGDMLTLLERAQSYYNQLAPEKKKRYGNMLYNKMVPSIVSALFRPFSLESSFLDSYENFLRVRLQKLKKLPTKRLVGKFSKTRLRKTYQALRRILRLVGNTHMKLYKRPQSAATASVALITKDKKLVIARLLGMNAVLAEGGSATVLGTHSEKKKTLLGFFKVKSRKEPLVIPNPGVTLHPLTEKSRFCLLAPNRLWAVITPQEAVAIVTKALDEGKTLHEAAATLAKVAIERIEKKPFNPEGRYTPTTLQKMKEDRVDIGVMIIEFDKKKR